MIGDGEYSVRGGLLNLQHVENLSDDDKKNKSPLDESPIDN